MRISFGQSCFPLFPASAKLCEVKSMLKCLKLQNIWTYISAHIKKFNFTTKINMSIAWYNKLICSLFPHLLQLYWVRIFIFLYNFYITPSNYIKAQRCVELTAWALLWQVGTDGFFEYPGIIQPTFGSADDSHLHSFSSPTLQKSVGEIMLTLSIIFSYVSQQRAISLYLAVRQPFLFCILLLGLFMMPYFATSINSKEPILQKESTCP